MCLSSCAGRSESKCFPVAARRSTARSLYNGYGFEEFVVPRTAAYVDQSSNHIAELTVRETLDFAQRVQGVDYSAPPSGPVWLRSTPVTCVSKPG